jgi:hypothetical protein
MKPDRNEFIVAPYPEPLAFAKLITSPEQSPLQLKKTSIMEVKNKIETLASLGQTTDLVTSMFKGHASVKDNIF